MWEASQNRACALLCYFCASARITSYLGNNRLGRITAYSKNCVGSPIGVEYEFGCNGADQDPCGCKAHDPRVLDTSVPLRRFYRSSYYAECKYHNWAGTVED